MAVGPLDPVASWVTGGTTVASPDLWFVLFNRGLWKAGRIPETAPLSVCRGRVNGRRKAITGEVVATLPFQSKWIRVEYRNRRYGQFKVI